MNPSRQLVQARLMVTFARVVESGSISMAATLLSLDKAGISRQISELEAMLGVKLLNRSTRGLCLTDVGSAVYERAARVVAELESTHAEAEHARAVPSGVLSISASVAFGVAHLVPHLGAFSKQHPEIKLDLCLLDRHVDPFEEGIDVLLRICDAPPDNMVASRLTDIRYALVAAPTFLACTKPLTSPQDLAGIHCLFYGFRKHTSVWGLRCCPDLRSLTTSHRARCWKSFPSMSRRAISAPACMHSILRAVTRHPSSECSWTSSRVLGSWTRLGTVRQRQLLRTRPRLEGLRYWQIGRMSRVACLAFAVANHCSHALHWSRRMCL